MGKKMPVAKVTLEGVSKFPRWYTIVSKYNYEKKLAKDIMQGKEKSGLNDYIFEVVVPIRETTVQQKKENHTITKIKEEKLYPLYVFIYCIMNERVWNFIKNSEGSQTILAPSGSPTIIEENDILKIKEICGLLKKEEENIEYNIKVGDSVSIMEGPCKNMCGKIIKILGNITKIQIGNIPVEIPINFLKLINDN